MLFVKDSFSWTMPCLSTNLDFNEAAIEFAEFGLLWVRSLGVVSLTRTRYTDAETHWQNSKIDWTILFLIFINVSYSTNQDKLSSLRKKSWIWPIFTTNPQLSKIQVNIKGTVLLSEVWQQVNWYKIERHFPLKWKYVENI